MEQEECFDMESDMEIMLSQLEITKCNCECDCDNAAYENSQCAECRYSHR